MPILVIGLGVLLVLTTGALLVGPRLRAADRQVDSGPSTSPPTSLPTAASGHGDPTGSVDEATRRVTVNGATMVLPGDPFKITPDPVTIEDVFDVCFLGEAVVHQRGPSTPGWAVMVGLAHLDPVLERTLDASGPAALKTITHEFFGSHPTRLTDVVTSTTTVDGRTALQVTAAVHYQVKGLASTHDMVTAIVVELPRGGTVVAMTSIPDDTPVELRRMAEKSLHTLTIG